MEPAHIKVEAVQVFPVDQQLSNVGHRRKLLPVWEHQYRPRSKAVLVLSKSFTHYQLFSYSQSELKKDQILENAPKL